MLTIIENGTIRFDHGGPPKGGHKTYARWLPRKLESVEPIELSEATYDQLVASIFCRTGRNPLCERRSDNKLVAVIGDHVFMRRAKGAN